MKRILCSLLVATLPFGGVLAAPPKQKNATVTLVYQHELPNVAPASATLRRGKRGRGRYPPPPAWDAASRLKAAVSSRGAVGRMGLEYRE
jgi:hypothetical protein